MGLVVPNNSFFPNIKHSFALVCNFKIQCPKSLGFDFIDIRECLGFEGFERVKVCLFVDLPSRSVISRETLTLDLQVSSESISCIR